jgi:hypothetical protein
MLPMDLAYRPSYFRLKSAQRTLLSRNDLHFVIQQVFLMALLELALLPNASTQTCVTTRFT